MKLFRTMYLLCLLIKAGCALQPCIGLPNTTGGVIYCCLYNDQAIRDVLYYGTA
jgi:hypothetical protein